MGVSGRSVDSALDPVAHRVQPLRVGRCRVDAEADEDDRRDPLADEVRDDRTLDALLPDRRLGLLVRLEEVRIPLDDLPRSANQSGIPSGPPPPPADPPTGARRRTAPSRPADTRPRRAARANLQRRRRSPRPPRRSPPSRRTARAGASSSQPRRLAVLDEAEAARARGPTRDGRGMLHRNADERLPPALERLLDRLRRRQDEVVAERQLADEHAERRHDLEQRQLELGEARRERRDLVAGPSGCTRRTLNQRTGRAAAA